MLILKVINQPDLTVAISNTMTVYTPAKIKTTGDWASLAIKKHLQNYEDVLKTERTEDLNAGQDASSPASFAPQL